MVNLNNWSLIRAYLICDHPIACIAASRFRPITRFIDGSPSAGIDNGTRLSLRPA